jgi:hypothetical protein
LRRNVLFTFCETAKWPKMWGVKLDKEKCSKRDHKTQNDVLDG